MSAFHDVTFPLGLAFGASGGPARRTDITQLSNGSEFRNSPHAHSRRRYNASAGIKSHADMERLIAFFEARHGQLHSFRFKDPVDYAVDTGFLGQGNGQTIDFQLIKIYGDSAASYRRVITKPRPETVSVFIDGQPLQSSGFSVNAMTGVLTLGAAPIAGSVVTASFEFDVAVRFDTDGIDLSLEAFGAGEAASIPLIEVLDYA